MNPVIEKRISPVEKKSYAQRRELFKGIWNATMLFDDDGDATAGVTVKPKIIKTLRLEGSSHVKASIRKKRLKNLRTVCNKILAFCDRQEEDNFYSDQIPSGGYSEKNQLHLSSKTKKKKTVKKAKKSLFASKEINALDKSTDFEKKNRNISGDASVPVDRSRKRASNSPTVAFQMASKLTSTRSPLRHTSSPSPSNRQNVVSKKRTKKKNLQPFKIRAT